MDDQNVVDGMNKLTEKGLLHLSLFVQWLEENLREDDITFLKAAAEYDIEKIAPCTQTAVLSFVVGYLNTPPPNNSL